uniref:DUF262 domain-containing protein n=1 Tax=Nonomuraea sp. CA-251285 TaxID=3240002 RepID=UPI003F49179C
MTLQTAAPLVEMKTTGSTRAASEVANWVADGDLLLDPPYQRESVWTPLQRLNLVKSWMVGLPIPSVTINFRDPATWRGDRSGVSAVVDGLQRIETAVGWFTSKFMVPASWFPADAVVHTEAITVDEGPYVAFNGLRRDMQLFQKRGFLLPVLEARVPTLQAEAELYLLLNSSGTAQTATDLGRAQLIAERIAR